MSFEPKFEKIVSSYKKMIGEMQSQIECRLPISDEAESILCSNAKVNMGSVSATGNAINYDGVALMQVVYKNTMGEYSVVDYSLEFKDKYLSNEDIKTTYIIASHDVVDIKTVIEGNIIRVVATINVVLSGIMQDNVNVLVAVDGDGVYSKFEDMEYSHLLGIAEDNFDTSFDVTIRDSVSKILAVCPNVYLDRTEANDGYMKLYSVVDVTVTYITSGDKADVRTFNNVYDFTQEVALSGMNANSIVMGMVASRYSNIRVESTIEADTTNLNVVIPVDYKGYVWNNSVMQIVSDIYSTTHYLKVNTEGFNVSHNYPEATYSERLTGSAMIEDNDPMIDEVLGVCASRVSIVNARDNGDIFTFDGIATFTILYSNNETRQIYSQVVDLPFSVDHKADNMSDGTIACASANIVNISVKGRRGTEFDISADLVMNVHYSHMDREAVIDSIQIEDEKPPVDCNLVIYIAREGDTIWDIAKEMSISEDIILEQNPNLTLPIQAGTRIVVYRQKIANI
ncbi:MAG: LysM peptidoglycan-binding domain-containing protein [Clostridiales bacterium]|nr:LysM peptidoglycan-binding domain-containing protein [Clostridiales bacterium]